MDVLTIVTSMSLGGRGHGVVAAETNSQSPAEDADRSVAVVP